MRTQLRDVQRLVVKIGSNVLTTAQHKPNRVIIRQLVRDLITLRERGVQVAIVTSGAVAAGMGQLKARMMPAQDPTQPLAQHGEIGRTKNYR